MTVLKREKQVQRRYRPEERKKQIIDYTKNVIITEGYAKFSLRYIALQIGVTLSTVQYYFPTKEDLFRATFEEAIRSVNDDRLSLSGANETDKNISPKEQLQDTLETYFQICKRKDINSFFFQLWAQADHDEFASELMDNFYAELRCSLINIIRKCNDNLSIVEAESTAFYIMATLEGLILFSGRHCEKYPGLANIEAFTKNKIMHLVFSSSLSH